MERTLAQIRAWNIWVYYSERVNTIILACREAEFVILSEQVHYRKFIVEQNERLSEALSLTNKLEDLDMQYNLGKSDCIEQWIDSIQEMKYFTNQSY